MENVILATKYRTNNFIIEFKHLSDVETHYEDDFYVIAQICTLESIPIIPIVYFRDCYNRVNGSCEAIRDGELYYIEVSKQFIEKWYILDDFFQLKLLVCVILHELGHYINGDLNNIDLIRDYDSRRGDAIKNNCVTNEEKKADLFAVNEIGKSPMISMLDKTIRLRKERQDQWMDLAIKEIKLRKKVIKNM